LGVAGRFPNPPDHIFGADSKKVDFVSIVLKFMEILGNFDCSL